MRGAFDDIHDIAAVPVPFTPACDGHPLAPITGPIPGGGRGGRRWGGAFEEYSNLEKTGYNRAFSLFGKAMSWALERDTNGARSLLDALELRPATPMAVNICALRCILSIIDGKDTDAPERDTKSALSNMPTYVFVMSPIKALWQGILRRNFPEINDIKNILLTIGAVVPGN